VCSNPFLFSLQDTFQLAYRSGKRVKLTALYADLSRVYEICLKLSSMSGQCVRHDDPVLQRALGHFVPLPVMTHPVR